MKLTLLSGVFVCDCEIDISNWCIQLMSSSLPVQMSVVSCRLNFSVVTFNVNRGKGFEYSFKKRVMS